MLIQVQPAAGGQVEHGSVAAAGASTVHRRSAMDQPVPVMTGSVLIRTAVLV